MGARWRGIYSEKNNCSVIPKNEGFTVKPAKTVISQDKIWFKLQGLTELEFWFPHAQTNKKAGGSVAQGGVYYL